MLIYDPLFVVSAFVGYYFRGILMAERKDLQVYLANRRVSSSMIGAGEVMVLMLHKAKAQEESPNRLRSADALNIRGTTIGLIHGLES
jgi:hypothetical protein